MNIHIPADTNTGINFNADDDIYIVDAAVTVSVADDNAFFGAKSFSGNTIQILGTVETTTANTTTIQIQGSHASVQVKAAGKIESQTTAIWLQGEKSSVSNGGIIDAVDFGIRVQADGAFIKNDASLTSGGTGIRMEGTGGEIENYGTITAGIGVKGMAKTGNQLSLFNEGTITGTESSFDGSNASDTVNNHGTMDGNIFLQGGNDHVDMTGGTFDGTIFGGFGNDVYRVDAANIALNEKVGEGNDVIMSSVSFTIRTNFETLHLLGVAKINATGSSNGDHLIGNNGANIIKGRGGDDAISGGKGDDVLTGNLGVDTFIFALGTGHDTITDFDATGVKHDVIDLGGFAKLKNFGDIRHDMEQSGADVILTISRHDSVTLEHVKLHSLDASDFHF